MSDKHETLIDRIDPMIATIAYFVALGTGYVYYMSPPDWIQLGYPVSVVLAAAGAFVVTLEVINLISGRKSIIWGEVSDR